MKTVVMLTGINVIYQLSGPRLEKSAGCLRAGSIESRIEGGIS